MNASDPSHSQDSRPPILVLLSGGRGWPNVWSFRAYEPDAVYYLPPAGNEANTQYIEEFLEKQGIKPTICVDVDAFDKLGAHAQCRAIIEAHPDRAILFHVTSAPKMMAFGATEAVWLSGRDEMSSPYRVSALHRDTANARNGDAAGFTPPPGPYRANLDDYVAAYGRTCYPEIHFQPYPQEKHVVSQAALRATDRDYRLHDLFAEVRSSDWAGSISLQGMPQRAAYLRNLQKADFVTDLQIIGDDASLSLTPRGRLFLKHGHWLEWFAVEEAKTCVDTTGHPLFSDCRSSLKIPNHATENELDLVCLTPGGLALYASCKTKANPFLDETILDEIIARAGLIGGNYCLKAFITTAPCASAPANFFNKAAAQGITVICGENLRSLKKKLEEIVHKGRTTRPVL